jgi:hypothetical protein
VAIFSGLGRPAIRNWDFDRSRPKLNTQGQEHRYVGIIEFSPTGGTFVSATIMPDPSFIQI